MSLRSVAALAAMVGLLVLPACSSGDSGPAAATTDGCWRQGRRCVDPSASTVGTAVPSAGRFAPPTETSRFDVPCRLEAAGDGFGDQLSGITAPLDPASPAPGAPLTYRGQPVLSTDLAELVLAYLPDGWIVTRTAESSPPNLQTIIAAVDPATASVRGDTYRLTGCDVSALSRAPDGTTWMSVCALSDTGDNRGTVVRLDRTETPSFTGVVGVRGCPKIRATTERYVWLANPSESSAQRMWRIDRHTGEWSLQEVEPHLNLTWSGGVLWALEGSETSVLVEDPVTVRGPTGARPAASVRDSIRGGQGAHDGLAWFLTDGGEIVAFDRDLQPVRRFHVPGVVFMSAGPSGILLQRATVDANGNLPVRPPLTIQRLDPATGATVDLATRTGGTVDVSRAGKDFVGTPVLNVLDQTGGWTEEESYDRNGQRVGRRVFRLPASWFAPRG